MSSSSKAERLPEPLSRELREGGARVPGKGEGEVADRISYTVSQAAAATGISGYVLYKAIREDKLPAYQPSGDLVILTEDLRAWIKRRPARRRSGDTTGAEQK